MPSAEAVLTGLTAAANDAWWLAAAWHVLLAVFVLILVAGWRPSMRLVRRLLVTAVLSVSVMAWISGNPFNGTVFALLFALLAAIVARSPHTPVRLGSPMWVTSGIGAVVFGATYPHFVTTDSWTTYLYASPFGILPCPTLSVVIGVTLLFGNLRPRSWSAALALAGVLYGAIGVFRLGVALDWGLLLVSLTLAAATTVDARRPYV